MKKSAQGFGFIELVVVLAILSVLAGLLFPLMEVVRLRQQEADLKQALSDIRQALDAYRAASQNGLFSAPTNSGYPDSLESLTKYQDSSGRAFLRAVPADPFFAGVSISSASTWRLRSYNSPPDSPQPGPEIFDVYSSSKLIGSNGLPYSQW